MLALLSDTTSVNESFGFVLTSTSFIPISIDYSICQQNLLLGEICSHIHRRVSGMIQPPLHIRKIAMIKNGGVIVLIITVVCLQSNQYPSIFFR